jgi:hypothetical protein
MKIRFHSLSRPKRAAKVLSSVIPSLELARAQDAIGYICGFDNWEALRVDALTGAGPRSPNDEDMPEPERASRRAFQARRAQEFFKNSGSQARMLVLAVAPSAKRRGPLPSSPVLGTPVYGPVSGMVFDPDFPLLQALFPDVSRLELTFKQPDEGEPLEVHLAETVKLTFNGGLTLETPGVFLWKFRNRVPPPLSTEDFDYLEVNPFSATESSELTHQRLLAAHDRLFRRLDASELIPDPPLRASIDFATGALSLERSPGLTSGVRRELESFICSQKNQDIEYLQRELDNAVTDCLAHGYIKLAFKSVTKNPPSFRRSFEPGSWAGLEDLPFEDFLSHYSAQPLHPSGCGGNATFRDLLTGKIGQEDRLHDYCGRMLVEVLNQEPVLFRKICNQLGAPLVGSVGDVTPLLLATKERLMVQWHLMDGILKAQAGKVLGDWLHALPDKRPPRNRPLKAAGAKP